MEAIYKDIRTLLKLVRYGWLLNHHQRKMYKILPGHKTVSTYHLEMAEHYFEKIWGRRPEKY